ncbi:unnamed protein product [Auanema sp. JU1783]|nr:unnamed protein product [Auanema sp. JU1783]
MKKVADLWRNGVDLTVFSANSSPNHKRRSSSLKKLGLSLKRSSVQSESSSTRSASVSSNQSFSCELWLLSALQGCSSCSEDRQNMARHVSQTTDDEKDQLIDFLQAHDGAVAIAMENNACKQFICATHEIPEQLKEKDVKILVRMWTQLYQDIIPNLQGILYPLKSYSQDFDIRKCVLTAFRDRVVVKLIEGFEEIPELESMLFTLLLETDADNEAYKRFSYLAKKTINTKVDNEIEEPAPVKHRSKTLPNKQKRTVTWQDMRKSATFSA